MTLLLLFQDDNGVAVGGAAGGPAGPTFAPAVHRRIGVRQPDVPSIGGPGLAFWGRLLRGLSLG